MAVKLADVSYLRRSPAERFVLRELIWLKQSKVNDPTEGYLALRCQMSENAAQKGSGQTCKVMDHFLRGAGAGHPRIQGDLL